MTKIYDVIAKRHSGGIRPDVCLYYDDDREQAMEFMSKYCKKNGFSIKEKEGTFSIANLLLIERESTGEKISEKTYRDLFNIHGQRL